MSSSESDDIEVQEGEDELVDRETLPFPPVPKDRLPPYASRDLKLPQIYEEEDEGGGTGGMTLKYFVAIAVTTSILLIGFGWVLMYQGELRVAEAENDCLSGSYGCDARDRSHRLSGLLIHNWGKGIVMFGTLMLASVFLWMGLFFDRFPSNLRMVLIIAAVILLVSIPLVSMASPSYDMNHLYD